MPRNKFMPSGIDGDEELEKIKGLLKQKVAIGKRRQTLVELAFSLNITLHIIIGSFVTGLLKRH